MAAFEEDGFNRPIEIQPNNTPTQNFDRPTKSIEVNDPTRVTYDDWARAFDFFNTELFDGELPTCLITYQRSRKYYGYFAPDRFFPCNQQDAERIDEIAINPMFLRELPDKIVLSTLVHEMAHMKRWRLIEPHPTSGYHDKKWAAIMIDIGLMPLSFDVPGKITGYKVSHKIIEGGRFDLAAEELLRSGFVIRYVEREQSPSLPASNADDEADGEPDGDTEADDDEDTSAKRRARSADSKTRFSCLNCKPPQNAWAKPSACLVCGNCLTSMLKGI